MKKFKAFSLVEMIITLGIMAIVVLIATQTLNTVFRVSTISKFKTVTRNEMSFSVELIERLLANSNVVDVYLYDPTPNQSLETPSPIIRYYDEENNTIIENQNSGINLQDFYNSELTSGDVGSELHIRPYGYSIWVCIGYFVDSEDHTKGYLVKRTINSLDNGDHSSCFDMSYSSTENPILVLNSEDVKVNDFRISYIKSSDINNVFYINLEMEPTSWAPGETSLEKAVIRQAIVTTRGLTWY